MLLCDPRLIRKRTFVIVAPRAPHQGAVPSPGDRRRTHDPLHSGQGGGRRSGRPARGWWASPTGGCRSSGAQSQEQNFRDADAGLRSQESDHVNPLLRLRRPDCDRLRPVDRGGDPKRLRDPLGWKTRSAPSAYAREHLIGDPRARSRPAVHGHGQALGPGPGRRAAAHRYEVNGLPGPAGGSRSGRRGARPHVVHPASGGRRT